MNTRELKAKLRKYIDASVKKTIMITGAPGIAKSSIVDQLATEFGYELIDRRLGYMVPQDIIGLPRVDEDDIARFARPEWLRPTGKFILFLDEFNMASATMMGIAQQLILDRRVGEHRLSPDAIIIAAGNRRGDGCAVNAMPAAVQNRFIWLNVEPELDPWLQDFAYLNNVNERVTAFLRFRPTLLHKYDKHSDAWPSMRSWTTASELFEIDGDISPAVGDVVATEFNSYIRIFDSLPDIDAILAGRFEGKITNAPDIMFATIASLVSRLSTTQEFINSFKFLATKSSPEYVSCFWHDALPKAKSIKGSILYLSNAIKKGTKQYDPELASFMERYNKLATL